MIAKQKLFNILPLNDSFATRESFMTRSYLYFSYKISVPRPKPLSTVVKNQVNARLMSQTAVINATLEKIAEAR